MTQQKLDLDTFIARVQKAGTVKDVYAILNEFRPMPWSDDDRALMAKAYVRVLEKVGKTSADTAQPIEDEGPDGPVWYEKM